MSFRDGKFFWNEFVVFESRVSGLGLYRIQHRATSLKTCQTKEVIYSAGLWAGKVRPPRPEPDKIGFERWLGPRLFGQIGRSKKEVDLQALTGSGGFWADDLCRAHAD